MIATLMLIGLLVLPAYLYRKLSGKAVPKGIAIGLLGGIWLALLWLNHVSGATGQPFWLHAGVFIAFGVLTRVDSHIAEEPEGPHREGTHDEPEEV